MKIYLDTTILTIYLFGQQLHPDRHTAAVALFAAVDANAVEAVVSLYALQELCSYCYNTFPPAHAPHATRLTLRELLQHPLLTRADRILFSRRFPMSDTSDQVHACTAYRESCTALITYDHHYQEITTQLTICTPAELLQRLP